MLDRHLKVIGKARNFLSADIHNLLCSLLQLIMFPLVFLKKMRQVNPVNLSCWLRTLKNDSHIDSLQLEVTI